MTRKRWLGLLVAALIVPLPAFAITGGLASASLGVSVSNGGCGIARGTQIVCQLQVSFNPIDGATRYTATVTAPNGGVTDVGAIGAGGASIPVAYTGDGSYSVTVSAWGEPPKDRHAKPLTTDSSSPVGHVRHAQATVSDSSATRGGAGRHAHSDVSQQSGSRDAGAASDSGTSATVQAPPDTSTDQQQGCVPLSPAPPAPTPSTTPPEGSGSTTTTATTPDAPPPPTCPDGTPEPANGCCPSP
jgi:hypothetical protein